MIDILFPSAPGAGFELVLRATLLMGVAWAAAAGLRKAGASAATRHIAWLLGISALLALPLLWWLVPALRLPILPAEAAPVATALATVPVGETGAAAVAWSPIVEYGGWRTLFLIAYALGAAALLVRFAIGRRLLSRLWDDAEPAQGAGWEELVSRLSRDLRLARRVEVRIARGPAMPMTWGTLAPKVLLPAEASEWLPERRRLVLLHELAHVARRDSLSRSVASLVCALYWFHPGAWFAARRLRIEQEHAADDRVLTAGAPARSYAISLLHLAKRVEGMPSMAHAASMAGMCQLEQRLVSITTPAHRERPGAAFLSASAAIAGLATLTVAAGVPVSAYSALSDTLRAQSRGVASAARPASEAPSQGSPSVETRADAPKDERFRREAVEADVATAAVYPEPRAATGAGTDADLTRIERAPIPGPPNSREEAALAGTPLVDYRPPVPRHEAELQAWNEGVRELVRKGESRGSTLPRSPGKRFVASRPAPPAKPQKEASLRTQLLLPLAASVGLSIGQAVP